LATGAYSQIGSLGLEGVGAPAGLGELGSTVYTASYTGTDFYTVNTATGAASLVSTVGLDGQEFNGLGSTRTGLYALDNSFNLYRINPSTGAATLIGSTGLA
jgi:hypothetical protein